MESANVSAGISGTADAAPSRDNMSTSPESEKESKTTVEGVADKDDSHKETIDQCATAQSASQSTSTAAAQPQDATASGDGSTSKMEDESTKDSTQNWLARFVAGHDLLWPSGLTPTTGPTLLTGVRIGESDHLIDNLMEWERKFAQAVSLRSPADCRR